MVRKQMKAAGRYPKTVTQAQCQAVETTLGLPGYYHFLAEQGRITIRGTS